MVFNQVINRRADNVAHYHSIFHYYFFQNVPEVIAYRANAIKGVFFIIGIMRYQVTEKIIERGFNQVALVLQVYIVIVNKLTEACAKTIG
jgi:hypothetical protein